MGRNSKLPASVRAMIERQHPGALGEKVAGGKRPKFNNVKCEGANGQRFDSKLERDVTHALEVDGAVVIPQVSIPITRLPKAPRVRVDALVIHERLEGGRFVGEFVDAKGMLTDSARIKYNVFTGSYGVPIRLERKAKKKRP